MTTLKRVVIGQEESPKRTKTEASLLKEVVWSGRVITLEQASFRVIFSWTFDDLEEHGLFSGTGIYISDEGDIRKVAVNGILHPDRCRILCLEESENLELYDLTWEGGSLTGTVFSVTQPIEPSLILETDSLADFQLKAAVELSRTTGSLEAEALGELSQILGSAQAPQQVNIGDSAVDQVGPAIPTFEPVGQTDPDLNSTPLDTTSDYPAPVPDVLPEPEDMIEQQGEENDYPDPEGRLESPVPGPSEFVSVLVHEGEIPVLEEHLLVSQELESPPDDPEKDVLGNEEEFSRAENYLEHGLELSGGLIDHQEEPPDDEEEGEDAVSVEPEPGSDGPEEPLVEFDEIEAEPIPEAVEELISEAPEDIGPESHDDLEDDENRVAYETPQNVDMGLEVEDSVQEVEEPLDDPQEPPFDDLAAFDQESNFTAQLGYEALEIGPAEDVPNWQTDGDIPAGEEHAPTENI